MQRILIEIDELFYENKYNDVIKKINEYLNYPDAKMDEELVKIYIDSLLEIDKIDIAYKEINRAISKWPNLYSWKQLARRYIICGKIELSEEIIKNCIVDELSYYKLAVTYLSYGYLTHAKKWFEYYTSISSDDTYKKKALHYLKEIHNHNFRNEFIVTNYLKFKRDGYTLEPGHIIYSKNIDKSSYEIREKYKPYMVWKIEDDKLYCFSVIKLNGPKKKYDYVLRKENYPNYDFDRKVSDNFACINESSVERVIDKVKYYDYLNVLDNIYRTVCFVNNSNHCKKFFDEYIKDLNISEDDIIFTYDNFSSSFQFYHVIEVLDSGYKVLKIEKDKNDNYSYTDENSYEIIKSTDYIMKAYVKDNEKVKMIVKKLKSN